ncbi:MAG: hypothetical protein EXS03_07985 [Phycisphaerales bacterium]|nr:hypothetical protein [Phycisphaerales bacterium]
MNDLNLRSANLTNSIRSAMRRAAEQALAEERRGGCRNPVACQVEIRWHHDPEHTTTYDGLDLSENGLRMRSELVIAEGLTGRANFTVGSMAFDRPCIVSWCRAFRDDCGRITHWEAGLRLI